LLSSEHETFNTLKNQGYNFEHNYGQVKQNLATILAFAPTSNACSPKPAATAPAPPNAS
jgi:hypothetical protein